MEIVERNMSNAVMRGIAVLPGSESTSRSARPSWRDPAGESPARVRGSARPVASVAQWKATTTAKRTQQLFGVWG